VGARGAQKSSSSDKKRLEKAQKYTCS
jgi:hypothetical protein